MCATAGLTVWAVRGGTMSYVLFNANNSGANARVFLQLLGELILLFGVIGTIWNVIWKKFGPLSGFAKQHLSNDPIRSAEDNGRSTACPACWRDRRSWRSLS